MPSVYFLIAAGFFAGFVDSVVGGGGLISLPALLSRGLSPHVALGSNKLVAIATTSTSSFRYSFAKIFRWRGLVPLLVLCSIGSATGAYLSTLVNASVLRPLILVLLVGASILVILKDRILKFKKSSFHPRWLPITLFLISLYDGFFGPGAGTFIVVAFLFLNSDDFLTAAAKGRWVNFSTSFGAFTCFALRGVVNFELTFPAACAAAVGAFVGSTLAIKKGILFIRPVFFMVTYALIIKVAYDLLFR